MRKFISAALAALAVISIGVAIYMYIVGSAAGTTITEYEKVTTYKLREPSTRYKFKTVDKSYFDDALFIGDSRTVGLHRYAELYNADFLAEVGGTVHGVYGVTCADENGYYSLMDLLQNRTYGKVYIMFGVNEIAGDLNHNISAFSDLVETVKEYQPNAIVYICANLHVAESYSAYNPYYDNQRLDTYNGMLSDLADGKTSFYIDINEVYDDENGNLSVEYTGDGIHLYEAAYPIWASWLCARAIDK